MKTEFLPWRYGLLILILVLTWLKLINGLMVTDVWDETNIILLSNSPPLSNLSIFESIAAIWTHYFGLYRPFASSLLALGLKLGANFEWLRFANAAMLVLAILIFSLTLKIHFNTPNKWVAIFFLLCLGSSSALISATWFANIFDVSCLLLISIGLLLALQGYSIWSSVAIGLSFYCKEIAIVVFPFLLILHISEKISIKELSKIYFVVTVFAAAYAFARQQLVDIGSVNDIHQFDSKELAKSTFAFTQSFWWGHTKFESNSIQANTGILFFCLSLLTPKDGRIKIINTTIVLLSSLAYWGMISYQNETTISSLNFIGRLYLVPTILILFLLTLNERRYILILLCLPILGGTYATYKDYYLFQHLYESMYEIAAKSKGILIIHYPEKPLNNPERNIRIEDNPNAPYSIDTKSAKLIAR